MRVLLFGASSGIRTPDTLLKRHNKRHDYQCIPQYLTCI